MATTAVLRIRTVLAALWAAGFCAGVAQVLLMRELMVIAWGNEFSIGLLLACWLLAGALGSVLARSLLRRSRSPAAAARAMATLAALPAPLLIASLAFARAAPLLLTHPATPSVLAIRPGEMLGPGQIALVGLLVTLGPAALNGAQFAVGVDLFCSRREGRSAGPAYAADAVGHLVGGVLLATAIVLLVDPFTVALGAAAVSAAAGLALAASHLNWSRRRLTLAGSAIALVFVAAAIAAPRLQHASIDWRWHDHEVVTTAESRYGNIAFTRQQPDGIYVYESGLYSGASPSLPGTVGQLVHFTMLQVERPREVLLIGGAVTGGLREVLKHDPAAVTAIEPDRKLLALARHRAAPADRAALRDPRVRIVNEDARRYLAQAQAARFDAILVALPDPATAQLNRMYTVGFYEQIAEHLTDGGVAGWQIPGSDGYFSPELRRLHLCLASSAYLALPNLARMPGESTVCVAGNAPTTTDWRRLHSRLLERGIDAAWFEAMLPDRLDPGTLASVRHTLRTDYQPQINTDLRPIGYFLDQAWWLTQFRPAAGRLLASLSDVSLAQVLAPVGGVALVLLGLVWARPVRTAAVPLALAGSGFASMALEVALLFAFQAFYGYVYHMVGVIIGAFMVGVAAGALWADRWLERGVSAARALPMALGAMALTALLLAVGLRWAGTREFIALAPVLFALVTALVGLVAGAVFPLAASAWGGDSAAGPAAWLYAADLTGAAVGALLGGVFLAPVIGLPGTCVAAAAVVGAAAVLTGARAAIGR